MTTIKKILIWLLLALLVGVGVSEPIHLLFHKGEPWLGWPAWVCLAIGLILGKIYDTQRKKSKVSRI